MGQPKNFYQPKPQQGKMPITMKSSCDSLGQSMNPIVFHRIKAMKEKYLGTIPKQNISYAMHFICISETHNLGQHFALNPDKICLSSLSWYLQNNISLSLSLRLIFRKGFTAHVAWIFGWMYSLVLANNRIRLTIDQVCDEFWSERRFWPIGYSISISQDPDPANYSTKFFCREVLL